MKYKALRRRGSPKVTYESFHATPLYSINQKVSDHHLIVVTPQLKVMESANMNNPYGDNLASLKTHC